MKRRRFCETLAGTGFLLGTGAAASLGRGWAFEDSAHLSHVEARYYKKHPDREVECLLCPRLCKLGDKERGYCGVRQNDGGVYYTLVYGKACSANVDPIEKKPFHFPARHDTFSIATAAMQIAGFGRTRSPRWGRAVPHFDSRRGGHDRKSAAARSPTPTPSRSFSSMFDSAVEREEEARIAL
jgi:hypothetical protein